MRDLIELVCIIAVLVFCIMGLVSSCALAVVDTEEVREQVEHAYFEGQKDCLNGNVRIKYIEDEACYVWIKSPWDSGKQPIYDPMVIRSGR